MFFVSFWESRDFDCKGHGTCPQHIDYPKVVKSRFKAKFLQTSSKPSCCNFCLIFTSSSSTCYFPWWPHRSSCIWFPQFHCDHLHKRGDNIIFKKKCTSITGHKDFKHGLRNSACNITLNINLIKRELYCWKVISSRVHGYCLLGCDVM